MAHSARPKANETPYTARMRIAFHRPENYVPAVQAPEAQVEGLLFVFRGDQLLVELGPPSATPSDDPRV